MRLSGLFFCVLISSSSFAQINPETISESVMASPQPTWLMVHDGLGPAYIFDSATGEMHGLLSLSDFTPAVQTNLDAAEIYAAESYYSRGTRGERTDVVTIYDLASLSAKAEVKIPNKIAALPFRQYIGLLDDNRHLGVFNLTPAFSVSVVDVQARTFVGEISTPGCVLIMPSPQRSFLQICGDGRLQLIRGDENGQEIERPRSKRFFDIEDDPVFDKPIPTQEGWLLTSYHGKVFNVSVRDGDISISKPWSLRSTGDETEDEAEDEAGKWRPGGGQFVAYQQALDLMFVLMNPGGDFAHDDAGTEVWIFNRSAQRRVGRIKLEHPASHLFVSQNSEALLTVTGEDRQLHVFDVATMKLVRSIAEAGVSPGLLQGF